MLQIVTPMKYTCCKSAKYIVSNERPTKTNFLRDGVPDRLTKLQNLIGMGVRCWSYSFKNCFIFRNICSKRTGNQLLDNMAASHDHPVLEKKRKAEVVMAASTKKSASALAHSGNSGGVSFHSDNVRTVNITFSFVLVA